MGTMPTEIKLEGCTARYQEGTIVVASNRDPSDRLVWTAADAEAVARIFRFALPSLASALRDLASFARIHRIQERRGES